MSMYNFPIYPHLGMTEAEFTNICEELFRADPVLAKHLQNITDLEAKIADYLNREAEHTTERRAMEEKLDTLRADVKALETAIRHTHSLVQGMKYHRKLAAQRINQAHSSIDRRKRALYLAEARRRLGQLGKELKLGMGRRVSKNEGTAVIQTSKRIFAGRPRQGLKDIPGFAIEEAALETPTETQGNENQG